MPSRAWGLERSQPPGALEQCWICSRASSSSISCWPNSVETGWGMDLPWHLPCPLFPGSPFTGAA